MAIERLGGKDEEQTVRKIVETYRRTYRQMARMPKIANRAYLETILNPDVRGFSIGFLGKCSVTYDREQKVLSTRLPTGGVIHYRDIQVKKVPSRFQKGRTEHEISYAAVGKGLRNLCATAKIPWVGTHGLRHSTSEMYLDHGATHDDVRRLFAHSSDSVTKRYIHDRGGRLENVAKVIRLFPKEEKDPGVSQIARSGKFSGNVK